jgi:tRNA 2-thiouridine synthesizing protein A
MDEIRTTSERTIEELKSRPGATEVFEQFGLHHCCTAHLSLREAAGAAGVSLMTLVDALDVRGLEPPQPLVRILERVGTLRGDDMLEALLDRRPLLLYPQLDDRGFTHVTDEPERGVVRVRIRRRAA